MVDLLSIRIENNNRTSIPGKVIGQNRCKQGTMIDKTIQIEEAIGRIADGAVIMVGGFGVPGTPFMLIQELVRQNKKHLTVIKNDANEPDMGVDHLLKNGQVAKLIVSHLGLNPHAIQMMNEGRIEVEFCAQGILAERIRAAGAGLPGFLTDIAMGTLLARDKPMIEFEGQTYLLEKALNADVALIHAHASDPFGNLLYAGSARNFNPVMAMAAGTVIAETENLLPLGGIAAEAVHTPGPFVDHVVHLQELTGEYAVVRR
jgi:acetate CoA/acetoacetate CoA-transferase alpha subunit